MSKRVEQCAKGSTLLQRFRILFYVCKFCGLSPYDLRFFQREHQLKITKCNVYIHITVIVVQCLLYNLMVYSLYDDVEDYDDRDDKTTKNTLNYVIGFVLAHIDVALLGIDTYSMIKNYKHLVKLFQYIIDIDERFYKAGHIIDNKLIERQICVLITITFLCELIIVITTFLKYIDYTKSISYLALITIVPSTYNTLDKIWYVMLLQAIKIRFHVINQAFNDLHKKVRKCRQKSSRNDNNDIDPNAQDSDNNDSIHKNEELLILSPMMLYLYKDMNIPIKAILKGERFQQRRLNAHKRSNCIDHKYLKVLLDNYCKLYTDLCEIGQTLNNLWNLPILVLIGYEFLFFIAQLYFIYCAAYNQEIPAQFSSAKNIPLSIIGLLYNGGKCAYLIYSCWQCSEASKYAGACLHRSALRLDNNAAYDIINHVSLKLLYISVDYSAFGLFSLDMKTLYAIIGSITTYLIILIQFNIAGQQQRLQKPTLLNSQNNTNGNFTNNLF